MDYKMPIDIDTDNEDSNEDFLNYNEELFDFEDEILIEESSEKVSNNTFDEVVNEGLNNEQMLFINGDFENITEALMFCWIQKHNISKDLLLKIIIDKILKFFIFS